MPRICLTSALVILLAGSATRVEAHFLFIRLGEPSRGVHPVEVFFSESAQAGDPTFIDRIDHTKLWTQTEPGKFTPLVMNKATDRLTSEVPTREAVSVIGECQYGVLKRETPFLLRYYPKAVAGDPAKLHALRPRAEIPLEIVVRFEPQRVVLTALKHGKPVPGAKFTTVDDDLNNEEIEANESGEAVWQPKAAGYYCVYTRAVTPQKGAHNGQRYAEIREFATIAFRWPVSVQK